MNYLAHVLGAEDRRKELGLPKGAAVQTVRWLCTRGDLRTALVKKARAYIVEHRILESSLARNLQGYDAWREDELRQERARAA